MAQAAKKRTGRMGRMQNPSASLEEAEDLSRRWHGREPLEITDVEEVEEYSVNLAELGDLVELNLLTESASGRGKQRITPISFKDCEVALGGEGNQLSFVGGDQELNLEDLQEIGGLVGTQEIDGSKQWLQLGDVWSIVYFTDKHHLTGPATQKKGVDYEHQFGKQTDDGELPTLVYDTRNGKMLLVGGSYEIRSEGIWN